MPLKPIDYTKTIFYGIVCNDFNIKDCYVGHTTNFIKRKQSHKNHCKYEKSKLHNLKVYQFIRENGGWDNWSMIMVEQISCENLNEACKIERKLLEEYKATLNMVIPYREEKESIKKYYEENVDKIKEQKKEYLKVTTYCDFCKKYIKCATKARHCKSKLHIKNSQIEN